MYIYPDNLKAKATMWLWELKDLAVIGILVLISVFGFAYAKLWFPLIFAGVYAFLTIQVNNDHRSLCPFEIILKGEKLPFFCILIVPVQIR